MITVPTAFHDMAENEVIPLNWYLRFSFDKSYDSSITFFTLNTSVLNGTDVLAPTDDNPIQQWDKYAYTDYSDRVISLEWSRQIEFPYSMQSALADVTVNNYDNYFSPVGGSAIANYILPKRPIKIFSGFKGIGTIQVFVGMSDIPSFDTSSRTAQFHAIDVLSQLYSMDLTEIIAMQDARTDEVLSKIFQQFGLSTNDYSLEKARNIIPFLYFEKGKNAGEIMRNLMEAEMGRLWIDEGGIIRFEPRLMTVNTPVQMFDDSRVIKITNSSVDKIINTINIKSTIRKVQDLQPVYSNIQPTLDGQPPIMSQDTSTMFKIPASSSGFFPNATIEDPCLSANQPTLGESATGSWFTVVDVNGDSVTSGVTVDLFSLHTNNIAIKFNNTNTFDVYLDRIEIWGKPAKIVDEMNYKAYDDVSVGKYGEQTLNIENDFIGSVSNAESLAYYTLDGFSDYASVITMDVKGDVSLQLGDVITVTAGDYNDDYKIIKMACKMNKFGLSQTITARHYTPRSWFILDQSVLNGTDVLAP